MGRAQIADFICPDNGVRGAMMRKGIQLKDHMKENVRQLRDVQAQRREQRESNDCQKEPYKLSQFKNVEARVYDTSKIQPYREPDGNFLTKGAAELRRSELAHERKVIRDQVEAKIEEARMYSDELPLSPRKASVPKENAHLARRQDKDWVTRNRVSATVMSPPRKEDDDSKMQKHAAYGRVPGYLENRKALWNEEKEIKRRSLPDPDCPRGMKLMPEDERLSTLEVLENSKAECFKQLGRLPFNVETPSMRKKQEALESKLREIENAINIFSKTKVFIAKDS